MKAGRLYTAALCQSSFDFVTKWFVLENIVIRLIIEIFGL